MLVTLGNGHTVADDNGVARMSAWGEFSVFKCNLLSNKEDSPMVYVKLGKGENYVLLQPWHIDSIMLHEKPPRNDRDTILMADAVVGETAQKALLRIAQALTPLNVANLPAIAYDSAGGKLTVAGTPFDYLSPLLYLPEPEGSDLSLLVAVAKDAQVLEAFGTNAEIQGLEDEDLPLAVLFRLGVFLQELDSTTNNAANIIRALYRQYKDSL